ncbi:MAG: PH domain-containing protein, partial [Xanthobacteraceae bacterium]
MFSVRPVFIGWIALLYQLPLQLFFTFWSAMFFGGLVSSLHILPKNSPVPFVLFGGLAFFAVPLVTYFGKKLNYARTVYNFLEDRLEFEEGFFNINEKVIKFKDVEEVTLRKGIFQRIYGLGTIYLATHATGSFGRTNVFTALGFGNISASGVGVCDIR